MHTHQDTVEQENQLFHENNQIPKSYVFPIMGDMKSARKSIFKNKEHEEVVSGHIQEGMVPAQYKERVFTFTAWQ